MGLREEKKRQARDRILRVCERLFRSRGFDETTIDEIARRARISRQTFFNYFSGKEAVLAEIGLTWFQVQAGASAAGPGRSALEVIRDTLAAQLRAIESDRDFMRLVFTRSGIFFPQGAEVGTPGDKPRLDRTRLLFEMIAGAVRTAQESGEVRADADPLQVAEMVVAISFVTIRLWLTDYWQTDQSLEQRALRALDLLMRGLEPRDAIV